MSDNRKSSFWVSYSDLATGLMIVFLLVMVMMVLISQIKTDELIEKTQELEDQERERQQEQIIRQQTVQEIVSQLQIILGTKPDFANSIDRVLTEAEDENLRNLTVDAVTAQLEIQDDMLNFETNDSDISEVGERFLQAFTPAYICTLWQAEQGDCLTNGTRCDRRNPETPGGVRRIMVTGSADLEGRAERNRELSVERAEEVVATMLEQLRAMADERSAMVFPYPSCMDHQSEVYAYARERLWAVGAGDTQHCTAMLNADTDEDDCDDILGDRSVDENYRRVTFELEVTGDDMTGLLLHVLELSRVVEQESSDSLDLLQDIAQTVAMGCGEDSNRYHGCNDFREVCSEREDPSELPEVCRLLTNSMEGEEQ